VKVVLVAALLLAVILTVVGSLTGMSIPDLFVKGVLTPIRSGISQLTDHAEQLYNYTFEYESLLAENQALKEQLAQIEDEARQADAIARENDRLRAMLELIEANEDYKLVDGYIISRSSVDWTNTFTINRGANVGIEAGMCAVTANGELVGLISEVGTNYAVIKTVLDSSLEISATIASSGYNGMVQGGYSTGLDGLLRMDYLPSSAVIRNNDQVVTTGSTVYPRNLILGHVVDAGFDDTGVAKYALLEPAADFGRLEQVFIITEYDAG
jgi:rod shape-determining protein MreC